MSAARCSKIGSTVIGRCVSRTAVFFALASIALLVVFVGYAAAVGTADRVTGRDGARGGMVLPSAPGGQGLDGPGPDRALPPGHPDVDVLPPGHPDIDGGQDDPGGGGDEGRGDGTLPPGHPRIDAPGDERVYAL